MSSARLSRLILVPSLLWLSWLLMLATHEGGHVTAGIATGGVVRAVVLHPAVLSRTDVFPNPHPLVEVWAGPLVGSLLPLALATAARRARVGYLIWAFAGFCLIANGAYLGVGAFDPVGDAKQLVGLGAPRLLLAAVGLVACVAGLYVWHRVSPRLGFGAGAVPIRRPHVLLVFGLALGWTVLGLVFGNRGE